MIDNEWKNGVFQWHGSEVWGQLRLAGPDTILRLRTEEKLAKLTPTDVIHGRLHDFTLVSCIKCVGGDTPAVARNSDGRKSASWEIFAHQVLTGRRHFDPAKDKIHKAWFSTPDIYRIFNDYDAFGLFFDPPEKLHAMLPKTIGDREIPIGPNPIVVYFAGRTKLVEAEVSFGNLEVQYWAWPNADSAGASIDSKMRVQVEFNEAVDLEECLKKVASVGQFLSLVAGRSQGIENVQIQLENGSSETQYLDVHWSFSPKHVNGQDIDTPDSFDIPLDGIKRPDEFKEVTRKWFSQSEHEVARARFHACRTAGNHFGVDRLVAAANLFDLTITAPSTDVSHELAQALKQCEVILRATPSSYERGSAIQAIKRVGAPTLMSKTLARAALLRGHFILDDLDKVVRQAILCRNYFVHGPGDKRFNFQAIEPFMSFLTQTLEFIFATAELIECGWAASQWRLRPHTAHHWFVRFIHDYEDDCKALLSAVEGAKSDED
jgi:hypothetical protein